MYATVEIYEPALRYFEDAMARALAEGIDAPAVVSRVRRLARDALGRALPEYVRKQFTILETLIRMIDDPASRLTDATRARLLGAFAYVAEPNDLIPDHVPEIGLLDDAIVVDRVARELVPEIEAYLHPDRVAIPSLQELPDVARKGLIARREMYGRMARRRDQRARRGGLFVMR